MKEEFVAFQKFNNQNSAIDLGNLLKNNEIDFLIENISINLDPVLSNNHFGNEYCVKLKGKDFEKAITILSEIAKSELNEVENDHYLFSFSDEELIDLISKSDEWSKFDVELAKQLLKERGKEVSEEQILEIQKQRLLELSKPEDGQNIYIIIGYVCAFLGGLLGLFIGWHLLTYKKTLPNGSRIYAYSEIDRKHGNKIVIIGVIFLIFWVFYAIFK